MACRRAKAEDGHRSPGTYEEPLKQDCVLPCPTANGKNLRASEMLPLIRKEITYKVPEFPGDLIPPPFLFLIKDVFRGARISLWSLMILAFLSNI